MSNAADTPPHAQATDPRSVARGYNTNIVAHRWAALWIDLLMWTPALIALRLLLHPLLATAVWALALSAYFVMMEARSGSTLGKRVMKVRVVDALGRQPGYRRATIRMLLRLIEVNPALVGGIPAGLVALLSRTRRRLGDILADTYVLFRDDAELLRLRRIGERAAEQGDEADER